MHPYDMRQTIREMLVEMSEAEADELEGIWMKEKYNRYYSTKGVLVRKLTRVTAANKDEGN